MTITDGEKTMTLEELAKKICCQIFDDNDGECWDGSCPAAAYCRHERNGMIVYMRKVVNE